MGEIGDLVKAAVQERLGGNVFLSIKHIQDFRNYKVSVEKAANVLSFHPTGDVKSIVYDLIENMDKFEDWENPLYSNIHTFKKLENGIEAVKVLQHEGKHQEAHDYLHSRQALARPWQLLQPFRKQRQQAKR